MAKLWPLLNYCELFMKCVFRTKFSVCAIMPRFRKSGHIYVGLTHDQACPNNFINANFNCL